ncbi:MAG: FAD-dependent oxidoreductase [Nocardioidaceae bacterium]
MRVLVVGAGVTGLTVAVCLAEAGHQVDVVARDLPLETTSAVAAALWYPYLVQPAGRVMGWAAASLGVFTELSSVKGTGVRMVAGTELLSAPTADPPWAAVLPDFSRESEVSAPYVAGWSFTVPVIEMPIYLQWLRQRLLAAEATLTRLALTALPERADLMVVNCAGLGARQLAADPDVIPVQGQVVRVQQVGLSRWTLDGTAPTYVVPRSKDIIVGGTDIQAKWSTRPDQTVAADILARARRLVPQLHAAAVLGHLVGLRPVRPVVRLEKSPAAAGQVIHCYGHGGAGVTLSWGCAGEVLQLVEQHVR